VLTTSDARGVLDRLSAVHDLSRHVDALSRAVEQLEKDLGTVVLEPPSSRSA
jgi:hypothetical protein